MTRKFYKITLKVEAIDSKQQSYLNDSREWINKVFHVNVFCSTKKKRIEESFGNCMVKGIIEKMEDQQ